MYIVTDSWRSSLVLDTIRTFTIEADAWKYYESMVKVASWAPVPHLVRGYKTFTDKPPVLIWSYHKDKKRSK